MGGHNYHVKWGFPEFTMRNRVIFAENKRLRAKLASILKLRGNEYVLDVGCGIGTFCHLIVPLLHGSGKSIGIDIDPSLIKYGNSHWGSSPNIHLQVGDVNHLPYQNQIFDLVASFGLIENVPSPVHTLSEMLRVTKRTGQLLFLQTDMLQFTMSPQEPSDQIYYRDLIEGMKRAGIDLYFQHFREVCYHMNLAYEHYVFKETYRAKITPQLIRAIVTNMQTYFRERTVFQQGCEFNYQFLRLVGWSKARVKTFFLDLSLIHI